MTWAEDMLGGFLIAAHYFSKGYNSDFNANILGEESASPKTPSSTLPADSDMAASPNLLIWLMRRAQMFVYRREVVQSKASEKDISSKYSNMR
jgi:hypothetical protein